MLFTTLKYLHILFAITAVGGNITYALWLRRAAAHPDHLPYTLRTIKLLDDRIANPAYGLLLITGVWMVLITDFDLTTPWILTALILYLILVLLGIFGYTPTLRRQITLAESEGPDSPAYQAADQRGLTLGILNAVAVLTIIYLMVFKPILWG